MTKHHNRREVKPSLNQLVRHNKENLRKIALKLGFRQSMATLNDFAHRLKM